MSITAHPSVQDGHDTVPVATKRYRGVDVPVWFADRDAIPAELLDAARAAFSCGNAELEASRLYCYKLWLCGWTGTAGIPPRPEWQHTHDDAVRRALDIRCLHRNTLSLPSRYCVNPVLRTGSTTSRSLCVDCGRYHTETRSHSSPAFYNGERTSSPIVAFDGDAETLGPDFVRPRDVTHDGSVHTVPQWYGDNKAILAVDLDDALVVLTDPRVGCRTPENDPTVLVTRARMVTYMAHRSGLVDGVADPGAMLGHTAALRAAEAAHPLPA
jgi:hypothetical protein